MNEDAVRALVRESIARRLATSPTGDFALAKPLTFTGHASHARYLLPESDGPCLIEPTVRCNRCGYCESHGH
jgi:hypothetical protein